VPVKTLIESILKCPGKSFASFSEKSVSLLISQFAFTVARMPQKCCPCATHMHNLHLQHHMPHTHAQPKAHTHVTYAAYAAVPDQLHTAAVTRMRTLGGLAC
jgi:hypothetical protein